MNKIEEIISAGKDLFDRGLVDARSGSISIRNGDKMLITRRNAMLGRLKEEDVIEAPIGQDGAGDENAAIEAPVHRAIYRDSSCNAIVEAFPPNAITLSLTTENKIIPQDMKGVAVLKSIPVVRAKAIMPGREKLGLDELSKYLPPVYKSGYFVSIVKEYCSFAVGADLTEALQFTMCLEDSCKISLTAKIFSEAGKVQPRPQVSAQRRTAIPPGIGVMDSSRGRGRGSGSGYKGGFGR